jgi:hypothetical protein
MRAVLFDGSVVDGPIATALEDECGVLTALLAAYRCSVDRGLLPALPNCEPPVAPTELSEPTANQAIVASEDLIRVTAKERLVRSVVRRSLTTTMARYSLSANPDPLYPCAWHALE